MERLASSTDDDAGPGGAVQHEDINTQSMPIDDENDNFKSEKSFLEDIARKQAEIIHGFPLVSLTGVSDGGRFSTCICSPIADCDDAFLCLR
jgi:hypothetical protein